MRANSKKIDGMDSGADRSRSHCIDGWDEDADSPGSGGVAGLAAGRGLTA